MRNTLLLLGSVIAITVVLGMALALLINDPFPAAASCGAADLAVLRHAHRERAAVKNDDEPIYGVLAQGGAFFGATPVDWLTDHPLFLGHRHGAWQWLPFACLIFITSLQSLEPTRWKPPAWTAPAAQQVLASSRCAWRGRSPVVVMIEMIFLMSVFAEIFTTTGGPATSTNVAFPHLQAGAAELRRRRGLAGALFAVVLANIAAVFLIRMIGKNLAWPRQNTSPDRWSSPHHRRLGVALTLLPAGLAGS